MEKEQFFTVSTPIGNLKDISKRAVETLENVDIIACEDKRVSAVLLSHFNISKPLIVYQKHNEQEASEKIISYIREGKTVALVSDAGVPCISDPGKIIVKKLYEQGIKTTNIPGACAVSTILASSPREDEQFSFYGFLPRTKNAQFEVFEKFSDIDLVFYESPNRLLETLENIIENRGKNQYLTIGRELTKKFEEIRYDNAETLLNYYKNNTLKGEIVCILYKLSGKTENDYTNEIKKLYKEGFSAKDISLIISTLYGANKKNIYQKSVDIKNS